MSEQALEQLTQMGFPRELAERALTQAQGNVQTAAISLLNGSENVKGPQPPPLPTSNKTLRMEVRPDQVNNRGRTLRPGEASNSREDQPMPQAPSPLPQQSTASAGRTATLRAGEVQPVPAPSPLPLQSSASAGRTATLRAGEVQPVPVTPQSNLASRTPTLRAGEVSAVNQPHLPALQLNHNASATDPPARTPVQHATIHQPHPPPHPPPPRPTLNPADDPRKWPAPGGCERLTGRLEKGMHIDVRDTLGKWLEAEVLESAQSKVFLHYIGWDPKWDEWLPHDQRHRVAPFHKYSQKSGQPEEYEKGCKVFIWLYKPTTDQPCWISGTVTKIDGLQMQVEYWFGEKKFQYWYHCHTDEIRNAAKPKFAPGPINPGMKDGTWFQGQFLEVCDPVTHSWRAAEVRRLRVETSEIFIHFDGLADDWDEWLHVERDAGRIRALGVDIPDTEEIKEAKREDEAFRKGLSEKNWSVLDVERDGNCLFRSVAHLMYGDVERHAEVRRSCYQYMLTDTEFFSCFVAEDFAAYVKRQQQNNQWGDHPEVIAMREMFNVNVEVYGKQSFPDPILEAKTPGVTVTLRLSFHGNNHYNAVLSKDFPPPLETSAKLCKVNIKQLRLNEVKTIEATAPTETKEDPSLVRQNTIRTVFGLSKPLKPLPAMNEPRAMALDVKTIAKKYDKKGFILVKDLPAVVTDCLTQFKELKLQHWRKQSRKMEEQIVIREFGASLGCVDFLVKELAQTANVPNNVYLVYTEKFVNNIASQLDALWGKRLG